MVLYVRACLEKDWQEDQIIKQTDVYYGSKNGHGIYNYRRKYPLNLPGEPRLELQIRDYNSLSADIAVGECIMSVGKMYRKIKTQGLYESGDVCIHLKNSNSQSDDIIRTAKIAISKCQRPMQLRIL